MYGITIIEIKEHNISISSGATLPLLYILTGISGLYIATISC